MAKFEGITDITSTEGKLWRYSHICLKLRQMGGMDKRRIIAALKTGLHINNEKVIERHISIMKGLGLTEISENTYLLSSTGKALSEIAKGAEKLGLDEKIFYFTVLFTSKAKDQLTALLQYLSKESVRSKKDVMIDYFSTKVATTLWKTASKNVSTLRETGRTTSFLNNKFACMEGWLQDIGLIKSENDKLTCLIQPTVISHLMNHDNLQNRIFSLAAKVYSIDATKFDYEKDKQNLYRNIIEAYSIFRMGPKNFADLRAISKYICVTILAQGLIMEEADFNENVERLFSEGLVRSIMLGRDGKPAHIVMPE